MPILERKFKTEGGSVEIKVTYTYDGDKEKILKFLENCEKEKAMLPREIPEGCKHCSFLDTENKRWRGYCFKYTTYSWDVERCRTREGVG